MSMFNLFDIWEYFGKYPWKTHQRPLQTNMADVWCVISFPARIQCDQQKVAAHKTKPSRRNTKTETSQWGNCSTCSLHVQCCEMWNMIQNVKERFTLYEPGVSGIHDQPLWGEPDQLIAILVCIWNGPAWGHLISVATCGALQNQQKTREAVHRATTSAMPLVCLLWSSNSTVQEEQTQRKCWIGSWDMAIYIWLFGGKFWIFQLSTVFWPVKSYFGLNDRPTTGIFGLLTFCTCSLPGKRSLGSKDRAIFRWFEELGPICELLEKASEIGVNEIKSPIGSLFQKYVSSIFMVKMRIDLGSFGLFWFILGWG